MLAHEASLLVLLRRTFSRSLYRATGPREQAFEMDVKLKAKPVPRSCSQMEPN
jgi:hypothetical protein